MESETKACDKVHCCGVQLETARASYREALLLNPSSILTFRFTEEWKNQRGEE